MVLSSCSKADQYKGSYTFKTGGYVVVLDEESQPEEVSLTPESGQMHVLKDGGSSLTVTMNPIGGSPVVYEATLDGDVLTLAPANRKLLIGGKSVICTTYASGTRKDNVLMLDFTYENEEILESHITCVAVYNE